LKCICKTLTIVLEGKAYRLVPLLTPPFCGWTIPLKDQFGKNKPGM
jgi:hypothetical protein